MSLFIIQIFVMTVSGSIGAFCFKKASAVLSQGPVYNLLRNHYFYFGGFFYLLGAIMNIMLLRGMDYSVVYPMTTLTYVWTMLIGHVIGGEKITRNKMIAVALILAGAIIINAR